MTATNGDLLFTKVLKKETSNYLRDLSWRRIHSRIILIYLFLLHHCVCLILVLIFSKYIFWAQSRKADSGWQRAYYYIILASTAFVNNRVYFINTMSWRAKVFFNCILRGYRGTSLMIQHKLIPFLYVNVILYVHFYRN